MSQQANIFLATTMTVADVAKLIIDNIGLRPVHEQAVVPDAEVVGLRGAALDHDGFDLLLSIKMNMFSTPDPRPEDVQSFDPYRIDIEAWVLPQDDAVRAREARALFDRLAALAPAVPSQLVADLAILVAAYLPGAGTHIFEPGVTPDFEDHGIWQHWSVTPSAS